MLTCSSPIVQSYADSGGGPSGASLTRGSIESQPTWFVIFATAEGNATVVTDTGTVEGAVDWDAGVDGDDAVNGGC